MTIYWRHDGIFYLGCWEQTGHSLFSPGMKSAGLVYNEVVQKVGPIDAGFIPTEDQWIEGRARVTCVGDCTVLSFPDNTVDKRGASNSTFIFYGRMDFDEALQTAKKFFPELFSRYKFEIVNAAALTQSKEGEK